MTSLTSDDLNTLTDKRLKAQYSLPEDGVYINIYHPNSSEYSRVKSVLAAAWFMKIEGDYYESCRALRGRDPSAARRKKASALRWLTAWLNTFCDGIPM